MSVELGAGIGIAGLSVSAAAIWVQVLKSRVNGKHVTSDICVLRHEQIGRDMKRMETKIDSLSDTVQQALLECRK